MFFVLFLYQIVIFYIFDVVGCLKILLIEEDYYQIWLIVDFRFLWYFYGVDYLLLFVNYDVFMVGYLGYFVDNIFFFIILYYVY